MQLGLFWCAVEEEENEEAQEEAPKDEAEIQVGALEEGNRWLHCGVGFVGIVTLMCFGADAGDIRVLV